MTFEEFANTGYYLTLDKLRERLRAQAEVESPLPFSMQPGWDPETPGREMAARWGVE